MIDKNFKILVVDDDLEYARTCCKVISKAGYESEFNHSSTDSLKQIASDQSIRLVLTDLQMPELDGLQFLKEIKSHDFSIEVIIMTGYGSIESAVQAIKNNASDYISKPFDYDELINAVSKIYKIWKLQNEITTLKNLLSDELKFEGFIFTHKSMINVYKKLKSAAKCNCSVFIVGESGTGKELIAQAVHNNSSRSEEPFIPINCSAISTQLIESELFGFKKGAFTGADRNYDGLFVAASGGTLFLDEIVEMQPGTQSKLLRAIQEKTIRPVGSVEEIRIDVRFVAAININLEEALKNKILREDLYHRLNVIQINIPPLRDIKEEIPNLVDYFVNKKYPDKDITFEKHILDLFKNYSWPGNIRELENIVDRLVIESSSNVIRSKDLPENIKKNKNNYSFPNKSFSITANEKDLIIKALENSKGNKSKAAELLGISRPSLYKKIELYNLEKL